MRAGAGAYSQRNTCFELCKKAWKEEVLEEVYSSGQLKACLSQSLTDFRNERKRTP